jgi:Ras-related GTP-binding protein C/D
MAEENYEEYGDGYLPEEDPVDITESATPRILMMGSRRSGKSSMSGVVFHKMPPHEVRPSFELINSQ